jgi:hypothetical protein
MLNLSSFSQTDTSKVVLPAKTARLIIKDLIEGDGCQMAMQQTYVKIQKLEEREAQKDTAITILKQKDSTNNYIILQKDEQLRLCKELSKSCTIFKRFVEFCQVLYILVKYCKVL